MSVAQLEHRPDGTTRFLALTGLMGGRWYSLHDVDTSAGRIRKVALGSLEASHRFFVQADRGRWAYGFAPGEGRGLTVPTLERQLQAARYSNPSRVACDGR